MLKDVFISYSRVDKEFVRTLHDALVAKGKDIWVDWNDIDFAEDWWNVIKAGIENANALIFVLSPNSVRSKVCFDEVEHAYQNGKRIIPLLYKDVTEEPDKQRMHPVLKRHNWLPFDEKETTGRWLGSLLETLSRDPEHAHNHTRLLIRARDWDRQQRKPSLLLRGDDLRNAEEWLSAGMTKEPLPIDIHTQYILASRQAERARIRAQLTLVSIGFIVSVILSIISAILYQKADTERNRADHNAILASIQADNALSRELAVRSLFTEQLDLKMLLSLQSLHIAPTGDARRSLYTAINSLPSYLVKLASTNVGEITSMALSPDGKVLITTGEKMTMWDTTMLMPLAEPYPLNIRTRALGYDPLGTVLVTGDVNGNIQFWDAGNLTPLGSAIAAHEGEVYSVVFNADGTLVASGGADGRLILWDIERRTPYEAHFPLVEGGIYSVAFDPLMPRVVVGDASGTLSIWDIDTEETIAELRDGHTSYILDLAFSPDGQHLLSAGADQNIVAWDMTSQQLEMVLSGHQNFIRSLDFMAGHPDHMISSGDDGSLILWDMNTGQMLTRLIGHRAPIWQVISLPETNRLISADTAGNLWLWDLAQPDPIGHRVLSEDKQLLYMGFANDKIIAAGDHSLDITLLGTSTLPREQLAFDETLTALTYSPSTNQTALGTTEGTILLVDITTNRVTHYSTVQHNGSVTALAWDSTGNLLASAGDGGDLSLTDYKNDVQLHAWNIENSAFTALAFNSEGTLLAAGQRDGQIILWSLENGEIVTILTAHKSQITDLEFHPDGKLLASASRDKSIILWAIPQMTSHQLLRHTDWVTSLAFSHQGNFLVSTGLDGQVIMWDVATGQALGRNLWQYQDWLVQAAIDQNDKLVVGSIDGGIWQWDIQQENWQATLCKIANRNLTAEEWTELVGDRPYQPTCSLES